MTNLTEQWHKGKLPDGWYYVKGNRAEGKYAYTAEYLNNMYRPRNGEIIIEQVPSFEQWQAKLEENTQLKKWCEEFNALEVANENTKLKELLKGAKEIIEWYKADCGYKDTPTEVTLQHINRLLGEE